MADWLNGQRAAVRLLSTLHPEGLAISLITYGEIYEGIYYGRDSTRSAQVFRQFLRGVDGLPLNRSIMQRFARVRGELRRTGRLIGDPDILIGVTALHHDLILLTRNLDHFRRILNLKLYQSS